MRRGYTPNMNRVRKQDPYEVDIKNINYMTGMNFKELLMKSLSGMAIGFFATLIIGTITGEFGKLISNQDFIDRAEDLKKLTTPAIGIAIASMLGLKPLNTLAIMIIAALGGGYGIQYGELVSTFIAVMVGLYVIHMFDYQEHNFKIFTLPLLAFFIGMMARIGVYPYVSVTLTFIGTQIESVTTLAPLVMGPILGIIMGLLLTSPISSVAIAFALGMSGIVAGTAMAGTSAQMISFGAMTFMATKNIGSTTAVGLGSSMLQFKNVVKYPKLLIIPAAASMVSGFLAALFDIQSVTAAAGMGTSSMVGPLLSLDGNNMLILFSITIFIPLAITIVGYQVFIRRRIIRDSQLYL